MDSTPWDAIVIGGGTAGLSAAQMLGRARRRTLVLDAGEPRNRFAAHMHGVLGLDGTPPGELIARGREEMARYGVQTSDDQVVSVEDAASTVTVRLEGGRSLSTRSLIVATGLVDDLPTLPGLAERWGRSVLHCPYCHGWEVQDLTLGVLLTSALGVHQAEMVGQWSGDVVVFTGLADPLEPAVRARLEARGARLIDIPPVAITGEDLDTIDAVALADGTEVAIDALFTTGRPRPRDGFLAGLDLARTDTPWGRFLSADPTGRTSHPRIWAAGNVVSPMANVPLSMGAGAMAGAAANGALVTEDVDRAAATPPSDGNGWPEVAPADFWENRYAASGRVWSGNPNGAVAEVVAELTRAGASPGRALDLGCGEGADVVWLASHGWEALGVDISETAIARARTAASASGAGHARFLAADLSSWRSEERFDLVTASFLQSPVALDRHRILRAAADRVAAGGHLLVISHAAAPPWAAHAHAHADFPTPEGELAGLALDPTTWTTVVAEVRHRRASAPDGTPAELDDTVVLLRRAS